MARARNSKGQFIKGALIEHEHAIGGQDKVVAANKKVDKSFDKVGKTMSDVFGPGGIAVLAANQAIELASKIGQAAKALGEFAKRGAQLSDLERAFKGLGNTADDLDQLRDSFEGAVTDRTLLRMSNTAAALGITREAFEKLGKVAVQQSKITGESVDFLLESLVTGVARESPQRLDNAGIIITNASAKISVELQKMGISADKVTASLRKTALANLVAAEAAQLAAAGGFDALGSKVASVGVTFENMQDRAAKAFVELLENQGVFDELSAATDAFAESIGDNEEGLTDLANTLVSFIRDAVEPSIMALGFLAENAGLVADGIEYIAETIEINPLGPFVDGVIGAARWIGIMEEKATRLNTALAFQNRLMATSIEIRRKNAVDAGIATRAAEQDIKRREAAEKKLQARIKKDEEAARSKSAARAAKKDLADTTRAINKEIAERASAAEKAGDERRKMAEEEAAFVDGLIQDRNVEIAEDFRERLQMQRDFQALSQGLAIEFDQAQRDRRARKMAEARAEEEATRAEDPIFQQTTETPEAETFVTQSEKMAGALDGISDAFGRMQFASDSALDALSQGMATSAGNLGKMSKAISAAGDDYMGMGLAVGQFAADQASDVIGSQTAQAGIFAAMEFAKGWASLESPVLSAAHFTASALFAGIATASAFGAGTSSPRTAEDADRGGAGGADPDFSGTAFDQPGTSQQAPTGGTTIIVQYQTPNAREGYEWLLGNLNDGNRQGTGLQLDASIIRGA